MTSHIVISRDALEDLLIEANACSVSSYKCPVWELPSGWLPIDQAPKDGTFVVLAHKDEDYWHREECQWNLEEWSNYHYEPYNRCGNEPTHFLPLVTPE